MHFGRVASAGGVMSAAGHPMFRPKLRRFHPTEHVTARRAPLAGLITLSRVSTELASPW
jgi:hypothetical protein